jgi:hypothetical protein
MGYYTEDGKTFLNKEEAQAHANKIGEDKERQSIARHSSSKERVEQIINCFNAGDWNGVLAVDLDSIEYYHREPDLYFKRILATAYRDNNYEYLLSNLNLDNPKSRNTDIFKAIKTIWEKKNGRTLTETDIAQLKIKAKELEKKAKSSSSSSPKKGGFLGLFGKK